MSVMSQPVGRKAGSQKARPSSACSSDFLEGECSKDPLRPNLANWASRKCLSKLLLREESNT